MPFRSLSRAGERSLALEIVDLRSNRFRQDGSRRTAGSQRLWRDISSLASAPLPAPAPLPLIIDDEARSASLKLRFRGRIGIGALLIVRRVYPGVLAQISATLDS